MNGISAKVEYDTPMNLASGEERVESLPWSLDHLNLFHKPNVSCMQIHTGAMLEMSFHPNPSILKYDTGSVSEVRGHTAILTPPGT
jgi:hypothetical protein